VQDSLKVIWKSNEAKSEALRKAEFMQGTVHIFIVVGYNFGEITIQTVKPIHLSYTTNEGEVVFSLHYFWENSSFVILRILSIVSSW
jgi:hypothetical protein